MKYHLWPIIALSLFFGTGTVVADEAHKQAPADAPKKVQPQLTAAEAMKAITAFRRDPFGKDVQAALSVITNFTVKSDKVMVKITEQSVPWAVEGSTVPEQAKILLTGAFLAGNVEAQLRSHIKGDSPYDGALLVLQVYKLLREKDMMPSFAPLEEWQKLESEGKLRAHLQGQ